ncbi:MAG: C1 family peptidase [Candidatus Zixiibacteriota bacterium]
MSTVGSTYGQLTADDIAALKRQALQEGWTFEIGENSATQYSLDQLCGLVEPPDWRETSRFDQMTTRAMASLPERFDWRDSVDLPPVKNQGGCGSCWAFGTVGPLECNIRIWDGETVDLSEQWLVSCNRNGWGCEGGWFAHDYHQWKTDACDSTGAVLEADYPYVAYDSPCSCPDPHPHRIKSWAFIGSQYSVPGVSLIKQAILDYGPVSVAVYVNAAFQAYNGGVFDGCVEDGQINHAVVLVGWDDTQGPYGVWFMRNSWGPGWGEEGYMRIPYNCSQIGYAACYINYEGGVAFTADTTVGWTPFDVSFTATSGLQVDTWTWDFGDGDSAFIQSPIHTYTEPGLYSVTVEIDAGGEIRSRQRPNYIKALADTLIPFSAGGVRYQKIAVPVYARNYVPLRSIRIPVEYDGDLSVTWDSFSTVGCRTEFFDNNTYMHYDPAGKRMTIKLECSDADMPIGTGEVAKLYFTVSPNAEWGDTTIIRVDGYLSQLPEFSGIFATYQPIVQSSILYGCLTHGDVDGTTGITVSDLTYLVDYLFGGGPAPLPEVEAGDVDCNGGVNVADITYLVNYFFSGGLPPCGC